MDFETATPPAIAQSECVDDRVGSRLFFTRGAGEIGNFKASGDRVARSTQPHGIRRNGRLLPVATGASCLALLVYGLSLSFGDRRSAGQTYHFILPPAKSAAAVEALPPPDLLKPLSPEEASKENSERPFVNRPDTQANRFLLKTDAEDRARALTCLAQAVYYEAAGESADGQRAVAQVVLNRVHHPGFPSTICGVVYEGSDRATGCQFSFTCDGSMQNIPAKWLWARSKLIAEQALTGRVFAPVGHATHYHADYILPYWADSLDKSVQIGRHIFYRLRSSLGDTRAFSQKYGGTEPPVREPGAALVNPQSEETQQLANALTGDGTQNSTAKSEKSLAMPRSPLLADSKIGTLLADGGNSSSRLVRPKTAVQCSNLNDRRQVSALKADDMRASLDAPNC